MSTIFNNIDRVASNPQISASVKIELLFDDSSNTVAKDIDNQTMIEGFHRTSTDSDGYWQATVVPTENITPVNNIYKITETITEVDNSTSSYVYYVEVPDSASPYFWVGNIQVEKPGWLS